MNATTTTSTRDPGDGVFTFAEMKRMINDLHDNAMLAGPPPLMLYGMKIIESPAVPMCETVEHYRGVGGYRNRWLVRKARIVRKPQVLISPMLGTMFINPRDSVTA